MSKKKKKTIFISVIVLILLAAIAGGIVFFMTRPPIDKTTASYNGQLRVDGARIVNQHNEEVQLIGISTHGIQWYSNLYNATSIQELKDEFGINVFRIAMYVNPDDNGYIANPGLKDKLYELVDATIELDMYAIIDWHILNDNNPQTYKKEALEFFDEVSAKYAESPNVIYEICNEPNGKEITWKDHIKPYAEEVIPKIREHAPNSLVIVGTPDWDKDLVPVSKEPLDFENVAYALHFYSGSHNITLRKRMDTFREKNLALFVSECGATDSTGDGKLYEEAFTRWQNYLNEKKISWVYWSFSNKDEASAIVKKKYKPGKADEETGIDKYLTESGQILKRALKPATEE